MKNNVPVLTFLGRTWLLLAFTILANFATLWSHVFVWLPNGQDEWGNTAWRGLTLFDICGAVLYVPALASAAVWVALLLVHLFFRQTLDQDAHDGTYVREWRELTAYQRVFVAALIRVGLILAICHIAASMAK